MGTRSFYLDAKLQNNDFHTIDDIMKSNEIYRKYFSYHITPEDGIFEIRAVRACFLPATRIIYDLLHKINLINPIEFIRTRNYSRLFDFETYLDFFCWMYRLWEDGIDYNYQELGAFLIPRSETYQMRWHLRKKYFVPYTPERQSRADK